MNKTFMQLTIVFILSGIISAVIAYIICPLLSRSGITWVRTSAKNISKVSTLILGISIGPSAFFAIFHGLFVIKLGPIGWIMEWHEIDIAGVYMDIFSVAFLSKISYVIIGICIVLYLASYIFVLSYVFGTISGLRNTSYKFYLPPYGYGVQIVYYETPTEWAMRGVMFGSIYLFAYFLIFLADKYLKWGEGDPFFLVSLGWLVPLLFLLFGLFTYVIEKLRGTWH